MQLLKANTQVIVRVGPFVDVGDGFTPQTDITLGGNEAELLKAASVEVDISGRTWTATTNCRGWYDLTLTTSDTDTEGTLVVVVQDDSDCLPVFAKFMVMAEAAWDSMFAAKDDGFMDINIKTVGQADTTETEANNLQAAFATGGILAGVVTNAQGADVATDVAGLIDGSSRVDVGSWLGTAVTLGNGLPDINVDSIDDTAIAGIATGGKLWVLDDAGATVATEAKQDVAQTELDKIGTIPALDSGAQTIGAAIAKLADDNGGADFDAGEDSLNKIRDDRTLAAADYVVVGDTIAGVTAVTDVTGDVKGNVDGTVTGKTPAEVGDIEGEVDKAFENVIPASPTANSINEYIQVIKRNTSNQMEITESNGNTTVRKDDNTTPAWTVAAAFTSNATTTTRKQLN